MAFFIRGITGLFSKNHSQLTETGQNRDRPSVTSHLSPVPKRSYFGEKAHRAIQENHSAVKELVDETLLGQVSESTLQLKNKLALAIASPQVISPQNIDEILLILTSNISAEARNLDASDREALAQLGQKLSQLKKTLVESSHSQSQQGIGVFDGPDLQTPIENFFRTQAALVQRAQTAVMNLEKREQGAVAKVTDALTRPRTGLVDRTILRAGETLLGPGSAQRVADQGLARALTDDLTRPKTGVVDRSLSTLDRHVSHNLRKASDMVLGARSAQRVQQKGLAGALTDDLTQPTTGLVDRSVGRAISTLDERLTQQPHHYLLKLKKNAEDLCDVLENPSSEKQSPETFITQINACLQLIKKKPDVFAKSPLTQDENTKLSTATDYINAVHTHREAFDPHFAKPLAQFIGTLYEKQCDPVSKAGAAFYRSAIKPALQEVENLPERMIEKAIHKAKAFLSPEAPIDGHGQPQQSGMQGFLQSIGSMFKDLLTTSTSAISREWLLGLSSLLTEGIAWLQDKIQNGGQEFAEQNRQLQLLNAELEQLKTNPAISLTAVKSLFRKLIAICDTMHICINGCYLPHWNDIDSLSEEEMMGVDGARAQSRPTFYRNAQILRDVHAEQAAPVQRNYEALTNQELNLFIQKTAEFVTLKIICESICNDPHDADFYCRMISAPHTNEQLYAQLSQHIRSRGSRFYVTWWRLFWAYLTYHFLKPWIHDFAREISTKYSHAIFQYIRHQKNTRFENFTSSRLTDALDYFTILNDTFESIPRINPVYGSVETMLQKELEHPARNHGQTLEQIYDEMIQNVFNKAEHNWLIAWFLNKIRKAFPAKVQSLLDSTMNTLQDSNGYSHALNTVIVEFLEKIDVSLKTSAENRARASTPQLSAARKKQLSSLVKILFSILEKSKCENIEELRNLIRDKSIDDPIDMFTAVLTQFLGVNIHKQVVNEIVQSVTLSLADALDTLIQEDNLQELAYRFIHLLNENYTPDAPRASLQEKNRMENRVQELASSILRTSIDRAIDDKGNKSKEQGEVNTAIDDLRTKTESWVNKSRTALNTLENPGTWETVRTNTKGLCSLAEAFQSARDQEQSTLTSKNWDDINREALNRRYDAISNACNPFITKIAQIERERICIEHHPSILGHLQAIHRELNHCVGINRYEPDVRECLNQLNQLKKLNLPICTTLQTQLEKLAEKLSLVNSLTVEEEEGYWNAIRIAQQQIREIIESSPFFQTNYVEQSIPRLQNSIRTAINDLNDFETRSAHIFKKIPFVNVKVIDKALKDKAKEIVFKTTKQYTDELIKFGARKETGYSLLVNLVLSPYNRYERWKREHPSAT